jgi:hypothetical protein
MTDDRPEAGESIVVDEELREDAVDVLRDALAWRLPPARWAAVAAAVDALSVAVRTGDMEAVRAAVAELELAGPVRAISFGETPVVEAPAPVREEINALVCALDGRATVDE